MHAFCGRLCVPWGLHADFKARSGCQDASLQTWYVETLARYEGQPIGDDLFVFWRRHFEQWVGTVTAKASGTESAAAHTLRAARSLL